jgi:PEGA domain
MSKNPLLITLIVWTLLLSSSAQDQSAQPAETQPLTASAPSGPTLEDGTPVKLRMGQTVSSADAHVGDSVALEVLEEVRVGNIVVVPKGGIAMATVTSAQSKRSMGRGGKLDINIDYAKLSDGEKAALRAVKDVKGGGHTGAMTGAMVATSIIFFPAAPLFLFMKGKDITIPKGTEVTAFVSGDMPLNMAKFQGPAGVAPTSAASGATELNLSSTPAEAEIGIDGNFVGNTPSSVNVAAGDHTISIRMAGYEPWDRTIHTSAGKVNLAAMLLKAEGGETVSSTDTSASLANAARTAKAKQAATQNQMQSGVPQN